MENNRRSLNNENGKLRQEIKSIEDRVSNMEYFILRKHGSEFQNWREADKIEKILITREGLLLSNEIKNKLYEIRDNLKNQK